jgi:hypothetical protein
VENTEGAEETKTPAVDLTDIKATLNGAPSSAPDVATSNVQATPAQEEASTVQESKP